MKLKVCGMKYADNMTEVARIGPQYMGFIFWEPSSRFFDGSLGDLPDNIKKVGVFVNADLAYILEKISKYDLQAVQLHGTENPEFCKELRQALRYGADGRHQDIEIIKVFPIQDNFNFSLLEPYETECDYFLFDTQGKLPGGNGYTFSWEVLQAYPSRKPYFLSGGIGLEEVDKIKEFLNRPGSQYCHAIDVNSKFEREPGLKEVKKLQAFKKEVFEY